jgi:hypothetical protein
VLFGLGGSFSGDVIFGLAWSSVLQGCCEMDKKFLVESKSFAFSVLAGMSALRVEEKRKNFLGVVILNCQSSEWVASMLEVLLGLSEEQEIVKSFREGLKLLIARRGGNKDGLFLEVSSFGLGGQKWFIVIPKGRGGWGWIKFSDELRKVVDFLSGPVGSGSGSSEGCSAEFGFGSKVDGTLFCGGFEVGSGHCCEGVVHRGWRLFQVKGFVAGAL